MKEKLKNPYVAISIIVFLLFFFVFLVKGIYPFGENTLIYGDMHDQITAFYYHFYDFFHGNASLFVDFSTSGGINFWGILCYYILSPVSFLLLIFPRDTIYLAVSLVVALKILITALTALFSLRVLFKDKLSFFVSIILALSYAFSGYTLLMWQITPWMDAVYLFPLVVVGLKKVLDLEKPTMYIVTLSLSFIFSFYVSFIALLFILFLSIVYIYTNTKKENRGKILASLGFSTILSLGISAVVVVPSMLQIMDSSRLQILKATLLNSKTGPLYDKMFFFLPSVFLFSANFLLLLSYRKHKKFFLWYFPTILFLLVPFFIEPINKMLHFGTYAMFPCRFGYIFFYFLMIGAGYYFVTRENCQIKLWQKWGSLLLSVFMLVLTVLFTWKYYDRVHEALFHLTITGDKGLFFAYAIFFFGAFLTYLFLLRLDYQKRLGKNLFMFLFSTTLIVNGFLYFGIEHKNAAITTPYLALKEQRNLPLASQNFRMKIHPTSMVTNSGMVSGIPSLNHFTSLVNEDNLTILKQLGFTSCWTETLSRNGTLFSDALLANQYLLSSRFDLSKEWYTLKYPMTSYNLYELKVQVPYGFFTKNIDFDEEEDTFHFQNRIYQASLDTKEDLFKVYDDFTYENIERQVVEGRELYQIVDSTRSNQIELEIPITKKQVLYLAAFTSFLNSEDKKNWKAMNIYINDQLLQEKYPREKHNGTLYLGTFENERVNIKIVLERSVDLSYLKIGGMKVGQYLHFLETNDSSHTVSFHRNQIRLSITSEEEGLFFLPITYDEGYKVMVNGEDERVTKVYGNFLGVELEKGKNEVVFTYIPKGFTLGLVVSFCSLLFTIILLSTSLFSKMISFGFLGNLSKVLYYGLYGLLFFFIYFLPLVCFFLSFFFYIS